MNKCFVFLCFIFIIPSCNQDPCQPLIDKYHEVNECKNSDDHLCLIKHLDSVSTAFIQELSNKSNQNFKTILPIAKKYKLELTCTRFVDACRNRKNKDVGSKELLTYLSLNAFPWLSETSGYRLVDDKLKCGENLFAGITRKDHHGNRINWIRFTEETGELKLNLIYSLQLHELSEWKVMKKEFYKEYGHMPKDEILELYNESLDVY